jgi:heme exporter protein CcmD
MGQEITEFLNFLNMGGYAIYVCSAYAITLLVLLGNLYYASRS